MRFRFLILPIILLALSHDAIAEQIPLEIKQGPYGSGSYSIEATVDKNKTKFLLDTGSKFTSIQTNAQFSKYKINGFISTRSLSGKRVKINTIIAKAFELGTHQIQNKRIALLSEGSLKPQLMGIDVLNMFCMELNHSQKPHLTLLEKCKKLRSRMKRFYGSFFIIPVKVGHKTYNMLFDTGASITVLDPKLKEKIMVSENSEQEVKLVDSAKVGQTKSLHSLKELSIDGQTLSDTFVVFNELESFKGYRQKTSIDGILGFNVISQLNWKFDPKTQTFSAYKLKK